MGEKNAQQSHSFLKCFTKISIPIVAFLLVMSIVESADAQIFFGSRRSPYYGRRSGFSISIGRGGYYGGYPYGYGYGFGSRSFLNRDPYGYHMNIYRSPFSRYRYGYGPQIYIQRVPSTPTPPRTQSQPAPAQPLYVAVLGDSSVIMPVQVLVEQTITETETSIEVPIPPDELLGQAKGDNDFPPSLQEAAPEPKLVAPGAEPTADKTKTAKIPPLPEAPEPIAEEPRVKLVPQPVGSMIVGGNSRLLYSTNPNDPAFQAVGKNARIYVLAPIATRDFTQYFSPTGGTHLFAFVHPRTGHTVGVELRLPNGRPKMDIETREIELDYGSYEVEVDFRRDGRVSIDYDD